MEVTAEEFMAALPQSGQQNAKAWSQVADNETLAIGRRLSFQDICNY
jgi:hypothetical protein